MKVGIRFSDNDFWEECTLFLRLYIVPTFIEREKGHMITHLTSSQIVEMFNTYAGHLSMYLTEKRHEQYKYPRPYGEHENLKARKEYLQITEQNIYWDNKIDDYIGDWEDWNNSEFFWTDGKEVYTS